MATPRACPASEAPPAAPGRIRGSCAPPGALGQSGSSTDSTGHGPAASGCRNPWLQHGGGHEEPPPVGLQGVLSELGAAAAALPGVEAGK